MTFGQPDNPAYTVRSVCKVRAEGLTFFPGETQLVGVVFDRLFISDDGGRSIR